MKPLILVVNDDGYQAPGIEALVSELSNIARVVMVAPKGEQSGQSQAITIAHPLRLERISENVYCVDGSPADCVMMALQHLLDEPPAWVISGINRGGNLGTDTLYSGTVGAALEACITGHKAMAVSLEGVDKAPMKYDVAAKVTRQLIEQESVIDLQPYHLLNVNIPNFPFERIQGIKTATLGRRIYEGKMWERDDPRGHKYYWIGGSGYGHEDIPGSDCVVLNDGHVTLSILKASFFADDATDSLNKKLDRLNIF